MLILDIKDDECLLNIHNEELFPYPSNCIVKRCAVDNGKLVAAGLVRLTTESILIIDESLPLITRLRAIEQLIEHMKPNLRNLGIAESHAFIKNPKMKNVLSHFGFKDCIGSPMIIQF